MQFCDRQVEIITFKRWRTVGNAEVFYLIPNLGNYVFRVIIKVGLDDAFC